MSAEKCVRPHRVKGLIVFATEPSPTNYDINFTFFGIPVRIHPFFFLLPVLWGANSGDIFLMLIFILVFFVSVFVHELGHVLAMKSVGQRARIMLYSMGGLAIPDGGSISSRSRHSTGNKVMISAAGPLAGFLLAAAVIGIGKILGGQVLIGWLFNVLPIPWLVLSTSSIASNHYLVELFEITVLINIYMNLFNLLPIIPMDGGQIMRDVSIELNPWNGMKWALWTSIVVAGLLAIYGFSNQLLILGLFSAHLAITNYQTLQMNGGGGFGGGRRPW